MNHIMTTSRMLSLDQSLRILYEKMIDHQQKGEYVDAERCRVEWEHRKEELKDKQLHQMENMHKRQRNDLNNELNNEIKRIDDFWSANMDNFFKESQENIANLFARQKEECLKLQDELNVQLSTKVKESSELLNLRKMQEQMAKQKNYVQAHRVQQKIKKMFIHEQQVWLEKRAQKISQALINLRNKHAVELANMKKRIKTTEEDNTKDHHFEILRIKQKYENMMNDLRAHQERESLSFKGEFRTLGGGSPTSSPNKSKMEAIKV